MAAGRQPGQQRAPSLAHPAACRRRRPGRTPRPAGPPRPRAIASTSRVSTDPGPTSTNVRTPAAAIARTCSDERDRLGELVRRAGRGRRSASAGYSAAVVLANTGTAPGPNVDAVQRGAERRRRRRPRAGCGTRPRPAAGPPARPARANASAARSISAVGPDSTVCVRGVLVGDDQVEPSVARRPRSMSASGASTASIAPGSPARCSAISRPRSRDRANRSAGVEPPGGGQGDEFAVAVPGERVGREAEPLGQHAPRAEADRPEGRLGDVRSRAAPSSCALRRVGVERGRRVDAGRSAGGRRRRPAGGERRGRPRRGRRASPGTGRRGRGACRRTATPGRGTARASLPGAGPRAEVRAVGRVPARPRPGSAASLRLRARRGVSAGRCASRWAAKHEPARGGRRRTTRATASATRAKAVHSVGTLRQLGRERLRRVGRRARRSRPCRPSRRSAFVGPVLFEHAWKLLPPKPNARQRRPPRVVGPRQPRPRLGVDVERRVGRRAAARPAASP